MSRICMREPKKAQSNFVVVSPDAPVVIEGAEIYDTLCPVSKLTGHRESPFKLLGKITGAKSELLNAVLLEIPSIASDPRLTDEDRVQTVVSRLGSGTPAEDAIIAKKLMADLDALGLSNKTVVNSDVQTKIDFTSDSNVSSDE